MNIHSKDQSGPRPTFWQLNLLFDGRQKRSELPCDKRVLTWPYSFEFPSFGMGDNLYVLYTSINVVVPKDCCSYTFECSVVYYHHSMHWVTEAYFQIYIFLDCEDRRTHHEILAWLTAKKGTHYKSNFHSNACLYPLFHDAESSKVAPPSVTRCGMPLMLITFDPGDSLHCWYDLSFGFCVCARITLG